MSETIRKIKDSIQSTVVIDDFAEKIDELQFGETLKKRLRPAGIRFWDLEVGLSVHRDFVLFSISDQRNDAFDVAFMLSCISLPNQDESKTLRRVGSSTGDELSHIILRLDEILAEGGGFLMDGKLTVQVEVRVDVLFDGNHRLPNYFDPFENCVKITSPPDNAFYAQKQVIFLFCDNYRSEIMAGQTEFCVPFNYNFLYHFLMGLHGVFRSYYDYYSTERLTEMLEIANHFGSPIFTKHLERRLFNRRIYKEFDTASAGFMKRCLKSFETVEQLQKHADTWKMEKLNLEMLKAITQTFFSFAIDYRECK